MKRPVIDYTVSDCCNAPVEKGRCCCCYEPCEEVIKEEAYYDEVRADDERNEGKEETA